MKTKIGPAYFTHNETFSGEVEIEKGDARIRVPVDSLRQFVAEGIRQEELDRISKMKVADILKRAR